MAEPMADQQERYRAVMRVVHLFEREQRASYLRVETTRQPARCPACKGTVRVPIPFDGRLYAYCGCGWSGVRLLSG